MPFPVVLDGSLAYMWLLVMVIALCHHKTWLAIFAAAQSAAMVFVMNLLIYKYQS